MKFIPALKRKSSLILFLAIFAASGCTSTSQAAISQSTAETKPSLAAASTATLDPSPSPLPSQTPTSNPTATSAPTSTPTLGPTATWTNHPPEKVVAPILLYHHVSDEDTDNRYVISTTVFTAQLLELRDWGYTVIPISILVDVLIHGGLLPQRPVVISFDDGNEDIYQNAFPIMKSFGDPGTFFMVANRLGSPGFVTADELKEMAAAGWEIGSHSWSHIDITKDHDAIWHEVANSRIVLQKEIGVPIDVFAYPFGTTDPTISQKVQDYGYKAAVGLGTLNTHTWGTLFYLSRQEVRRDYSMEAFSKLLPWTDAQNPVN